MSNVEKLKKKAAEFEQKKQFDRALEVYLQIIGQTEGQDDRDVTVYNRVGDLYLRLNKADQAVNYYEQAVDLYTDGGYLNNAIALCNKILRHAPARHQIYYKLGKISAKKGFNSDAKKNFLEYADRMHRAGKDTEAFKALQEFADLCPGQDDIRLMLADQLARAGKAPEAIEQLQILHESLDAEGRTAEAQATVERMHTLDPNVEPRRSKTPRQKEAGGLVFLDVGGSPPKPRPKHEDRKAPAPAPLRPKTPDHVQPLPEFEQLPDIEDITPITPIEGLELQPDASVADLEPAFDLSLTDVPVAPLEGLESAADPEQFAIDPEVGGSNSPLEGLMSAPVAGHEPGLGEPLETEDPLAGLNILEDDRFYSNDEGPLATPKVAAARGAPAADAESDLLDIEPLDLEIEEQEEEPAPPPARKVAQKTPRKQEEREEEERQAEERKAEEREEEIRAEEARAEEARAEEARAEEARAEEAREAEEREDEERKAEARRQEARYVEAEPPRSEPPKPSKPKLVEPLRMTRPKPKVEKAKPKEPEPEQTESGDRRPLNPFQRQRPKAKPGSPKASPRQSTPAAEVPRAATPKENPPHRGDDNFVDMADWLREDSGPRSYRMVAEEDANREEGTEADFTDMLEKFKAGVAANVDDEDFDSHYDLGVAYKEMGLIDEAIFQFQKALRGATQRIRAYEALGQCFIDRGEHDVAITVLGRALREPGMEDEDLIGVLYLLGFASEGNRKPRDAAAYYQRVFAIDIDFRDVSNRLKQMTKAASK
jgi:tetratricopeptide (TPR) repeat protein